MGPPLSPLSPPPLPPRRAIRYFDKDGTGFVDEPEMRRMLKSLADEDEVPATARLPARTPEHPHLASQPPLPQPRVPPPKAAPPFTPPPRPSPHTHAIIFAPAPCADLALPAQRLPKQVDEMMSHVAVEMDGTVNYVEFTRTMVNMA